MINPSTERQARCYQMLREPAFEPLIQHWMEERYKLMETLSVAPDEVIVRQLQGRVQVLSELIMSVEKANTLTAKLKGR